MKKKIIALLSVVLCLQVLFFLWIINFFVKVKICLWRVDRIGHLVMNTELLFRRNKLQSKATKYIFLANGEISNEYIYKKYCQLAYVINWPKLVQVLSLSPLLKKSSFFEPMPYKSNEYYEFNQLPPLLRLDEEEIKRGYHFFHEKINLGRDDWFVCLHIRTPDYLASKLNFDTSYHSYRDSTPANYKKAVLHVLDSGGWVFKVGHEIIDLGIEHPRYINYAQKYRDDFLDLFLMGQCRFVIGNTSGINQVSTALNVPVLYLNMAPLQHRGFLQKDLAIPKLFFLKGENRFLRFKEVVEKKYDLLVLSKDYSEAGIALVENSEDEICEAVKEMMAFTEGKLDINQSLQEKFRQNFSEGQSSHLCPTPVSPNFLKKYESLLS